MKIRTIQWNIGGGLVSDKKSDRSLDESYNKNGLDEIIRILEKENPDIVTLQEVHDGGFDQVKYIAEKLKLPYYILDHYSRSHLLEGGWLSQAIISRFPILGHHFSFFPNPSVQVSFGKNKSGKSYDKGLTTATINVDGTELMVKTLHMIPFRRTGFLPTDPVFKEIRTDLSNKLKTDSEYLLLQGDFNFDSESLSGFIKPVLEKNIKEVIQKYPTTPKGQRYDHVLYRGIKPISSRVNPEVMTDHFPVISDFLIGE